MTLGGRVLFEAASLGVNYGDRVALVGPNGAGKTTLFSIILKHKEADSGTVERDEWTMVGHLPQEAEAHGEETILEVATGRVDELPRLEKRLHELEAAGQVSAPEYMEAHAKHDALNDPQVETKAKKMLRGLGFRDPDLDRKAREMSGGWIMRARLARLLVMEPDLLLLDEPTNHLDADARDWLLTFLRAYRGALLVISHDLNLLDEAITRVIHLDREAEEATGEIVEYRGTYSQYLVSRELDEERLSKMAERQQNEIKRLSTLADSMRGQTAKRARVAKNLDNRAERIRSNKVEGPAARRTIELRFPPPASCGRTVLTATGLWKSYGSNDVFADVSFDVGRGERLLVMGLNGAGKTSLLKILAEKSEPDLGEFEFGLNVSAGYYAQEHEGIDSGVSMIDHMRRDSELGDEGVRSLLGMFGLSGEKVFQDAGTLSGGEKTKLALAQLVAGNHNLLLLDEPTNNLDPMSRSATGAALAAWPGTMVIVSHDVEFVEALAPDRILLMPDGQLDYFSAESLELVALA